VAVVAAVGGVVTGGEAHIEEAQLVRLLATLEMAREAVTRLTDELRERTGELPVGADAAHKAFRFVDNGAWLDESGTVSYPQGCNIEYVPCLEPLREDERDPYSGTVCGEDAKFIVWGGRGIREGSAVAYPACKEHARKWGSARRIGEDGSLISFDED
jgi:hypothetical protein